MVIFFPMKLISGEKQDLFTNWIKWSNITEHRFPAVPVVVHWSFWGVWYHIRCNDKGRKPVRKHCIYKSRGFFITIVVYIEIPQDQDLFFHLKLVYRNDMELLWKSGISCLDVYRCILISYFPLAFFISIKVDSIKVKVCMFRSPLNLYFIFWLM